MKWINNMVNSYNNILSSIENECTNATHNTKCNFELKKQDTEAYT